MTSSFEQLYNNLNPQQKQVVDRIDGPVVMLAGPGSGKTQVLAMRIANIIRLTDTAPDTILALTFTENAAENMRTRLVQLIGTDAYKIKIHTFHSFCNDIINSYPEKFIFTRELRQIDDLTRIKLLEEIISAAKLQELTIFNVPFYYLSNIQNAISVLKKEGITPVKFEKIISDHQKYFEENQEINAKTGKLKTIWQDYLKTINKNKELATLYSEYVKKLTEEGYYDYEDMILFVNRALAEDAELLADLQESNLYTLVDEYQDTNGGQNELVFHLNSYDDLPNLFVVGDEDQSIFAFQGANYRNIVNFLEKYPGATVVSTKYNYRSNQKILDAAAELISHNPERLSNIYEGVEKELIAGKTTKDNLDPNEKALEIVKAENSIQEVDYIVEKIKSLLEDGITGSEIAVIYRKHADAEYLLEKLISQGIRVESNSQVSIFEMPIIKKVLGLVSVISNPDDSLDLFAILHHDYWQIETLDLYKLFNEYGETKNSSELMQLLASADTLETLDISSEGVEKLTALAETLLDLRKLSFNTTLAHFYKQTLYRCGIINALAEQKDIESINALNNLLTFISSRAEGDNNYSLSSLLADITSLKENYININTNKIMVYEDGVRLLTAHAAKGLEFEHVFIIKAIDKHWGNNAKSEKLKLLQLYELGMHDRKQGREEQNNEERRLFYVALTRAKSKLYATYAEKYLDKNNRSSAGKQPSMFLREIADEKIEKVDVSDIETDLLTPLLVNEEPPEMLEESVASYLRGIVEKLRLSASGLNAYIECPHRFLYQFVLKVPKITSVHAMLGSAVHTGLEYIGRNIIAEMDITDLNMDKVIRHVHNFIDTLEATNDEKVELKAAAEEIIRNYVEAVLIHQPRKIIATEYKFSNTVYLEKIPLQGRVDALELHEDDEGMGIMPATKKVVRLVDYKNTLPLSRNKLLGANSTDPADKKYLRQLGFYTLLSRLDKSFKYSVADIAIDFTRPNSSKNYKREIFTISETDLLLLQEEINNVWNNIQNLEFSKRCEKETCPICQILPNSQLKI